MIFGAVLLAGAGAAAALAGAPRPRNTPALRRALVAGGVLALVAIAVVGVLKAGSFGSGTYRSGAKAHPYGDAGPNPAVVTTAIDTTPINTDAPSVVG